MKNFIDPSEKLIIKIPDDWYFTTNHNTDDEVKMPYGFEPYEDRNAAFQISYREKEIKRPFNIEPQSKGKTNINFIEHKADGIHGWFTNIEGGGVVIISLVYDISMPQKKIENLRDLATESVKSLVILDNESRASLIPLARWDRFMLSYAASIDLRNRALENGSNIELVILLANQIDSILRQSLILNKQLQTKSDEFDTLLIHQKEDDKPIMEKEIYKRAKKERIIDEETYSELNELYNLRNKVVHRYVISDLRSVDIIKLVAAYLEMEEKLGEQLIQLEYKQYEEKVGIYHDVPPPAENDGDYDTNGLIQRIRDKHGHRKMNEDITFKKKNNGG